MAAEGTYEFECMRAELLGVDAPDKEKFELEQAEKVKAEAEAALTAQANDVDLKDEGLNRTGGKLDELNSILSSTQKKLFNFKRTACGSLSNIFKSNSVDMPSTSGSKDSTPVHKPRTSQAESLDNALDNLEQMQTNQKQNDIQVAKQASLDIQGKMTSHLDKLDLLINKADNAELAMSAQTKQMKKFVK